MIKQSQQPYLLSQSTDQTAYQISGQYLTEQHCQAQSSSDAAPGIYVPAVQFALCLGVALSVPKPLAKRVEHFEAYIVMLCVVLLTPHPFSPFQCLPYIPQSWHAASASVNKCSIDHSRCGKQLPIKETESCWLARRGKHRDDCGKEWYSKIPFYIETHTTNHTSSVSVPDPSTFAPVSDCTASTTSQERIQRPIRLRRNAITHLIRNNCCTTCCCSCPIVHTAMWNRRCDVSLRREGSCFQLS